MVEEIEIERALIAEKRVTWVKTALILKKKENLLELVLTAEKKVI
jgi:hypothetical protein